MDLHLRGRTVVVTGGSSGIGLATIELLLAEGANVATCARDGDRLAATTEALAARHPGRLLARRADVLSRPDDGTSFADYTAALAADRGVVLGRVGCPDEVAPTIALLASSCASYTTGTTIDIAGGVGRYV